MCNCLRCSVDFRSAAITQSDTRVRCSAVPKQAPKGVVYQIVPDDKSAIHRPRALPDHSSAPAVIWNGNMAREEHAPRCDLKQRIRICLYPLFSQNKGVAFFCHLPVYVFSYRKLHKSVYPE